MDANTIYENYKDEFNRIISTILVQKEAAIPFIISEITTKLLPEIAQEIGQIKALDNEDKKHLLIQAITIGIDQTFEALDKLPELSQATWDNQLRAVILMLVGPILDNMIAVENGTIVLNSKAKKFFFCCL